MEEVKAGSTGRIIQLFLQDSSSLTGAGLAGLAHNSAGLLCHSKRNTAGDEAAVPLVAGTLGTWASGGFVAVDDTNMPGLYEFGVPDAALAVGATSVTFMFRGATNLAPYPVKLLLGVVDPQDAASYGMTPAAAADSVWDELLAGHNGAGSAGEALSEAAVPGPEAPDVAEIANAIFSYLVETGLSFQHFCQDMEAMLAGRVNGAGSGTESFRNHADTKDRVTVTTTPAGDRLSVTHSYD